MQVEVTWVEGMEFRADAESGHSWNMDASVEVGGNDLGPRPTEMLLSAVGGCTGIDIVSILKKMQQPLTGLRLRCSVSGQRNTPPFYQDQASLWSPGRAVGERWPGQCSCQRRSTAQY